MAGEIYTAAKLAEALGVSPGKVKKLLASLEIEPDEVKRGCKYYGGASLEKVRAALKDAHKAEALVVERQKVSEKIAAMQEIEGRVNAAIEEMNRVRSELDRVVAEKQKDDPSIRLVVTLYESIDAKKAADLIKRLDKEMAISIMRMMSPRKASSVLAEMDDRLAALISRMLVEKQRQLTETNS